VQASVLGEIGGMTGEVERRTAEEGAGEVEALREQLAKKILQLEQLNKQVRTAPPPTEEGRARVIIHWLVA
jgi:hypothetical protein